MTKDINDYELTKDDSQEVFHIVQNICKYSAESFCETREIFIFQHAFD